MSSTLRAAGWLRLSARAAVSHGRALATLATLAGVLAIMLAGIAGFLTLSATALATDTLSSVGASQRVTIIQARLADDAAAQKASAASAIASVLDTRAVEVQTTEISEGSARYVRWTFSPHPSGFTAAAIPSLVTGLDSLRRVFSADPSIATGGVTTDGSLSTTLADIQRRLDAEQGASLVPLVLVALIGLIALGQVSRLQAAGRTPELGLIRSRGASFRRLGLTAGLETLVATLPAALLGTALVILLLGLAYPSVAVDAALWLIPVALALASSLIVALSTAATARSASVRDPAFAGRGRTAIGVVALVLVFVVAALSFWQLHSYGAPVDPFVAAAPALVLLLLVIAGLALFAPIARLAERFASLSRSVAPSFPIRQVSRRIGVHAVSVTVVALAVGSLVLAAGYSATLERVSDLPSLARTGAEVRVVAGPSGLPALSGIDAVPVLVTTARIGSETSELVGVPAAQLAGVMTTLGGAVDTAAMAGAISADHGGVAVDGPLEIHLSAGEREADPYDGLYLEGDEPIVSIALVTTDDRGLLRALEPIELASPTPGTSITHGIDTASQRVVAIEVTRGGGFSSSSLRLTIDGLPTGDWSLVAFPGDDFGVPASEVDGATGLAFPAWNSADFARLVAPGVAVFAPVRAVVGQELATQLGLEPDDAITLRSPTLGEEFDVVVAGVASTVPGTTNRLGLVADLGAIETRLLGSSRAIVTPNQLWIRGEDATTAAALLEPQLDGATLSTAATASPGATPTQLALVLGSLGALALAAATLLAGASMIARSRAGEVRVLRALGMRRREIRAARRLELALVIVFAITIGAVAGLVASVGTVSVLARSATIGLPSALPVPLEFDGQLLLAGGAAVLVVLGIVALLAGGSTKEERA
jgi:hypothetical protein